MPLRTLELALLVLLLRIPVVCAATEPEGSSDFRIPYAELKATGASYLAAYCTEKAVEDMDRKLREHVQQKCADNLVLDEDSAMRTLMLDWAASNGKKIRRKDQQAVIQACFYFVCFIEKKFLMPWQIRNSLDQRACNDILKYLREEIEKKGQLPGKNK